MIDTPVACVIGDMDLVRPLGLAGIPVVAAGPTGRETRWSRYTVGGIDLPDLWSDPHGTVEALVSFAQKQSVRPVLFYQKDPAVLTISRHRAELEPYFRFVVPEAELVEALIDKSQFWLLATKARIPIPQTAILTAGDADLSRSTLRFPVIVKPAVRDQSETVWFPLAGHGAKAFQVESTRELEELFGRPELDGIRFVVQELIAGPESETWSYHAFIDEAGLTVGEFTGRKIRTRPAKFGQSTAVRIQDDAHVLELGRETLRTLNYSGVAKVDMKRDEEGRLHVLEINPRFSLWHHPGAVAGINLPAMVYSHLTSLQMPKSIAKSDVVWCQVWGDRHAARTSGISGGDWLRFVASAKSRRAAHLNDPGAMAGALFYSLSSKSDV